jgi:acyl dehydratase
MEPGTELGVSEWHTVTQEDINAFAVLTRDEDPYHTEPDWAREHAPLGTTISFGFLTLSMLTWFSHQVFDRLGIKSGDDTQLFNFGFNRVRLPEPVPAGARIRGRFTFAGARVRDSGGIEFTNNVVVEIEGKERPALVAEWLGVAVTEAGK